MTSIPLYLFHQLCNCTCLRAQQLLVFFLTEHGLYLSFFFGPSNLFFHGPSWPKSCLLVFILTHTSAPLPCRRPCAMAESCYLGTGASSYNTQWATNEQNRASTVSSIAPNLIYMIFLTLELYLCQSDNTHRPHVSCVISSTSELILRPFSVFRCRDI